MEKKVPMHRIMMQDGVVFFFLCLDQVAEILTSLMSLIKFSLTLAEVYFNSKSFIQKGEEKNCVCAV